MLDNGKIHASINDEGNYGSNGLVLWYVVLSCDEMHIVENQSWLLIHYYVVQNWVRIPIFTSLDIVIEGLGSDYLTKVI